MQLGHLCMDLIAAAVTLQMQLSHLGTDYIAAAVTVEAAQIHTEHPHPNHEARIRLTTKFA